MNRILLVALFLFIISGCNSYENKEEYTVCIGESFEIYYSTNSCCRYCLANVTELNHVSFVKEKSIDAGPSDCAGCDYTVAYVFKGESPGIDTVELRFLIASMDCDSEEARSEKYVIKVE